MIKIRKTDNTTVLPDRESGFGRYDIMLEPKPGDIACDGIIMEFKVMDKTE